MDIIQNIYVSAASRPFEALNMRLTSYAQRPFIVELEFDWLYDDKNSDEELGDETQHWATGAEISNGSRGAECYSGIEKDISQGRCCLNAGILSRTRQV